jgi:hypothetical protein
VGKRAATPPKSSSRTLLLSVLVGVTALLTLTACGASEGVEAGARVAVYAVPPQCVGAKRDLDRFGKRAGELRVRLVCLDDAQSGGRLDLAIVGANARRAVEDSSTVGFIEAPGRAARFSQSILKEAAIPLVDNESGATSMARLLDAIQAAGTASGLREAVSQGLE